jgi:hypothetical protein
MREITPDELKPGDVFSRRQYPDERLTVRGIEFLHNAPAEPRDPNNTHVAIYTVAAVGRGSVQLCNDQTVILHPADRPADRRVDGG